MFIYGRQVNMEPVRTILSNDVNDVIIYRDTGSGGRFFTVVFIKDRNVIEYVLELLDTVNGIESEDSDFMGVNASESRLALTFRYFPERSIDSFASVQLVEYKAAIEASRTFIERCMGSELPQELLWLAIDRKNISIDRENNVYFNYFLDFSKMPEGLTREKLADRAAFFVKSLLTDYFARMKKRGKVKYPNSVELFIRKEEKLLFTSFADVYQDILFMIEEEKNRRRGLKGLWDRLKARFGFSQDTIKILIVILVLAITITYVVSECRSRRIPAFMFQDGAGAGVYSGMDVVGRENLLEN